MRAFVAYTLVRLAMWIYPSLIEEIVGMTLSHVASDDPSLPL